MRRIAHLVDGSSPFLMLLLTFARSSMLTVEHGRGQDGVAGRFFSPSMRPINVSSASTVSPAPPLGVMPTHPNAKPLIKNRGDYSGTYASVCCCDQRPCKPLASFGQLR
jgi:hypothetical protein